MHCTQLSCSGYMPPGDGPAQGPSSHHRDQTDVGLHAEVTWHLRLTICIFRQLCLFFFPNKRPHVFITKPKALVQKHLTQRKIIFPVKHPAGQTVRALKAIMIRRK